MQIVLFGLPGAGKGTQGEKLTKKLFLSYISLGEILRAASESGSPLGEELKSYLDRGDLVPDHIVINIVKDRLNQPDCREGFLLDGFPRTVPQAEALDELLAESQKPLSVVLNIEMPVEQLIIRLSGRRVCKSCSAIYHLLYNAPQDEGICDSCGGTLYQRTDDQEQTVTRRLEVYEERTAPLVDFYSAKGLLKSVNGDQPMQDVLIEIGQALGHNWS